MENTPQNMNQYFLHHQTQMNISINTQSGHPYNQFYGFPNLLHYPNCALPQQMIYHPPSFIAPQSTYLIEQNANFLSETASQADIEKLLLETIPDLDGTEGNFEIRRFFKKFDLALQDWSEKKKIFALKSKLYGKAKSFFILAIKAKHYNYKSIKKFILCQLLPSEYKVDESIDSVKKQTHSPQQKKNFGENQSSLGCSFRTNSPQKKKNLKEHEKSHKQQSIPTPSFKNKVNIQFEKEEFSQEILEFFEMPINQDLAKNESKLEDLEENFLENFEPIVEKELDVRPLISESSEDFVIFEKDVTDEKELNVESLEDFGKKQFCELDEELICSLDGKQDSASFEFPIRTEIQVFQEIVPLDIPVYHEEVKEEIVCFGEKELIMEEGEEEFVELEEKVSGECDDLEVIGEEDDYRYDLEEKENEDCFGLKEIDEYSGDLKKILEEKGDEQGILEYKLDVFEKDPEKEIQPTRDKFKVLKENENIVEKRKMLRLKLREAIILARLRCDLAGKEILWNNFGEDFGYGILKRKITGRFFLGVRRCLNVEKLITLIRVSELSRNFLKEINRRMLESKPVKVLYLVSVTKQDVIRDSKGVEIEKDWKKRKRKEGKGLVESVSVTEILTIGVLMETFHRRSGSLNRVGLENPMITLTLRIPKSNKRKELPRHPRPFAKTDRTRRSYSDVEDAVI